MSRRAAPRTECTWCVLIVASDLSDKDIRASLLSHFDKPMVLNTEDTTKLIDLCESGFERDVYYGAHSPRL